MENVKLERETKELNEELKETIKTFHETNCNVWRRKVEMGRKFAEIRDKVRRLLLMQNEERDNDVKEFMRPDCFAQGYGDEWKAFL